MSIIIGCLRDYLRENNHINEKKVYEIINSFETIKE